MQFLENEEIIKMFTPLLDGNQEWEEHKKDNPDFLENIYFTLGEVARYILPAVKNNNTEILKKTFDSIEFVFIAGDKASQEKISTGFLEPLQNNMLGDNIDLSILNNYLNPQTAKAWEEIISGWNPSDEN